MSPPHAFMKATTYADLMRLFVSEVNKSASDGGVIPNIGGAWENIVHTQIEQETAASLRRAAKARDQISLP